MERKESEGNQGFSASQGWEPKVTKFQLIDRLSPLGRQVLREIESTRRTRQLRNGKSARKIFKHSRRG